MSSLELAVAKLRSLPEAFQGQAVEFIHKLHVANRQERLEALHKTAGCLSNEEADAMERAIQDTFGHVDGH